MVDGFKDAMPSGGIGLACAGFCSCACFGAVVTLITYFGIYGLNNPDPQAYYGIINGEPNLQATAADFTKWGTELERAQEAFPVHDKMVAWFLWGFILNLLPFAACLCMPLMASPSMATIASCFGGLLCTASSCGSLCWFITGSVFRFRKDFGYASGDIPGAGFNDETWPTFIESDPNNLFQISSGRFMWVFLMINYGTMAASCGCSLLVALCSAVLACFK